MSDINVLNNMGGNLSLAIDSADRTLHYGYKEYTSTSDSFSCTLEKDSAIVVLYVMGSTIESAKGGICVLPVLIWEDKLSFGYRGVNITCSAIKSAPYYRFSGRETSIAFSDITYANKTLSFEPITVFGFDANIIGYQIVYFED